MTMTSVQRADANLAGKSSLPSVPYVPAAKAPPRDGAREGIWRAFPEGSPRRPHATATSAAAARRGVGGRFVEGTDETEAEWRKKAGEKKDAVRE